MIVGHIRWQGGTGTCIARTLLTPKIISNIMDEELTRLRTSESIGQHDARSVLHFRRDFTSISVRSVIPFLINLAKEWVWYQATLSAVYLGPRVVEKIVAPVKKQAKEKGTGFVSTGDILVAFFIKVINQVPFLM